MVRLGGRELRAGAGATVLASPAGLFTDTPSFIFQAQQALHTHTPPQVLGRDSHRVRGDGVKRLTSVPPPRRSLIVWMMANGTTMPTARSSRLRVSTHSTAGRCRQETHKSPSTRWNHALVTQMRQNKSDFNRGCLSPLRPGVSVCHQSRIMTFT